MRYETKGGQIGQEEIASWVDNEQGVIDRKIYADPDIYQLELRRIFARAWNFMCHGSHIPEIGDYFVT